MPDAKGSKLYVNIGPSQAKRRLKDFGHVDDEVKERLRRETEGA